LFINISGYSINTINTFYFNHYILNLCKTGVLINHSFNGGFTN
jgi:hypothetical protein